MGIFKKIFERSKIAPITLWPGDSKAEDKLMIVDEAVLFEAEFEGRRAFGGMVVEQVK